MNVRGRREFVFWLLTRVSLFFVEFQWLESHRRWPTGSANDGVVRTNVLFFHRSAAYLNISSSRYEKLSRFQNDYTHTHTHNKTNPFIYNSLRASPPPPPRILINYARRLSTISDKSYTRNHYYTPTRRNPPTDYDVRTIRRFP